MSKLRLLLMTAPPLVAVGIWAGYAIATGAPSQSPLTWSGTVADTAGKPLAAQQDVTVSFYDAAMAGTLKCKSSTVQTEAGTGRFTVVLPADCAQAVHDTADLWSETKIGATLLPRVHVGAVPYALEADTASNAGGALKQAMDGVKADVDKLKSNPTGPWLVDAADISNPMALRLQTTVNGKVTQSGTTADMIFDVPTLIEYFSSFMTLQPGDLILTGTPDGIVDCQPGDVIVTEIEGIGALTNTIVKAHP